MSIQLQEESYERRIDLASWRKLFGYAWRYKSQVLGLAVAAIGTAAADTAYPLITRAVIDDVAEQGAEAALARYAWLYLLTTLVLCGCVWAFIRFGGRIRTAVSHDIRQDAFENLQRLSFSFFDKRPVGWLMSRMTSDCERLSNIFAWGVLDLVWGTTTMLAISIVMFFLDVPLALIVLAVVPFLVWVSAVFQKRILGSARIVRKTNSQITAAYNEGITGVRTNKVFVREDESLREFGELTGRMYGASVKNQIQSALYLPLVLTLGSLSIGLALAIGGTSVVAGGLTLGTMIAFITYTRHFFDPIQEMAHWFAEMQMAQASAERVLGLIEAEPEIRDSVEVRERIAAAAAHARGTTALDGYASKIEEIEFRDVSFEYEEGQRVLESFDLKVRAGETIALVGATGGGKSTIVGLLCRFYEPTSGSIRFDGVDYRDRSLAWLQSQLGIVLQTPYLFSGSILENVRYGRLDASDDDVRAACAVVGADEFIRELEDGYETDVGEGGNRLSTGQKQLVSFARAILAEPQILVMDEATSSIDTETERRIQLGLEKVLDGRTSFVIAHRLSTIRNADRILVIERGKILEQGTHAELVARRGRYLELYSQQKLQTVARHWADA